MKVDQTNYCLIVLKLYNGKCYTKYNKYFKIMKERKRRNETEGKEWRKKVNEKQKKKNWNEDASKRK